MIDKNYITKMLIAELNTLKEEVDKENNSEELSLKDMFKKNLLPGRIVELDVNGEIHFGFILESNIIVYITKQGQIKGYLTYCTMDLPYKILRILIPKRGHFRLKDCDEMTVAWERPKKPVTVKKTISDIEKELGLNPGTLEII